MAGRSAPKESVWFNEFDLFQYSLALSILKYLGQVLLARHRRKIPSVCPVNGSVITGKVCGNSYSCEKCRECCCWLTVGCENRKFVHMSPPEPVAQGITLSKTILPFSSAWKPHQLKHRTCRPT